MQCVGTEKCLPRPHLFHPVYFNVSDSKMTPTSMKVQVWVVPSNVIIQSNPEPISYVIRGLCLGTCQPHDIRSEDGNSSAPGPALSPLSVHRPWRRQDGCIWALEISTGICLHPEEGLPTTATHWKGRQGFDELPTYDLRLTCCENPQKNWYKN